MLALRLITILFLIGISAFCQTFNARIAGTVTDATGAPVPAATVTVRHIETNVTKKTKTAGSGVYNVPLLLPGTYEVQVEAPGMEVTIQRDIKLEVNAAATVDFRLKVSAVTTVVDVTADVPMLQTETSGVGKTIETRVIEEFPLIERDIMGLVRAIPGVVANPTVGQARGSRNVFDSEFSVAGSRSSMNEVLLDGSSNTIGDFNGVVVAPTQDSVQEFRVETSSYSAEFGRSGGGTVNIVTKAGTNAYHGTAYYYHQNDVFNANTFINNRSGIARPFLRRHQYGYSLGGPVQIPKLYKGANKTFFFSSFEGRRESNPINQLTSVPTAAQMAGDFSQTVTLVNGKPQLIQIFDPKSSRVLSGGVRTRTPFEDNKIPMDQLNPIALKLLKYYPAPNLPGSSVTGLFNYQYHATRRYSHDIVSNRVDQYISDKQRIFFRFNIQENLDRSPTTIVRFVDSDSTWDHFKNYALDDTWQVTPKLNNVFRYSYTRFRANLISNTLGFDPTTLGLPNYYRDSANILFFPNFSITGPFPNLGGTAYNNQPRDTQGIQDNLVYIRGRHNLKTGVEYRLLRFYPFQVFNPTGGFSFSSAYTQQDQLGAGSPTQGYGLASLLLGVGSFSFEHVEPLTGYHHYLGSYVQDDWKVTSRLTLNLGLRWEIETGTGESHNRLSYFDPNANNTAGGRGALQFTGGGHPGTIRATNWLNFGPRVGFAFRPFKKLVVRGGYGIFYLPIGLEPTLTTTPFNYTLNADNLNADYTPKVTLSNPFPAGLPRPNSANPVNDGSYQLGSFANIVLRNQPPEYMQEWNFAFSRQLARTTVMTVTYNGSRGVHLPIPSLELNQINPGYLANGGAFLTQLVPNPYFGKITSGLLAQPMIPQEQLLKPFPTYAAASTANAFGGSLLYFRPPVGDSIYHGMTVQFERRFTRGMSVDAHYTFSKLIDVGGVGNGAAFTDPSALRDIYNTRLERSLGSFDATHRIVVIYAIDLPFGGKKALGRSLFTGPKWAGRILSGWQILGFHTLQSGLPVNIGGPDLSRIAGASPSRASVVPGVQDNFPYSVSIANARAYNPNCGCTRPWFNPDAFTTTPQFVIPNGPRFLPNVRQGFLRNWDLTLNKNIRMNERVSFRLEAKFYNLLNQVTFAGPSAITVNGNNFGSAGGVNGNPRYLEVGGKLSF